VNFIVSQKAHDFLILEQKYNDFQTLPSYIVIINNDALRMNRKEKCFHQLFWSDTS
jgi:hypothetical protein